MRRRFVRIPEASVCVVVSSEYNAYLRELNLTLLAYQFKLQRIVKYLFFNIYNNNLFK
jgi:hypothetical protein